MNQSMQPHKSQRGYIRTSLLVLLAFAALFFSRPIDLLGAPETINFVHFALVPAACVLALSTSKTTDASQIRSIWLLIGSLLIFIGVSLFSALLNQAGFINVFVNFLLLCETFLMLLAVVSLSIPLSVIHRLQRWLLGFAFFNLFLAYFQRYGLRIDNPDAISGVFSSIAGASVSSIVSLTLGLYYCVCVKSVPLWIRVAVLAAAIWQILISDAKLVLGSYIVGFFLLSVARLNRKTLLYIIGSIVLAYSFIWAMQNIKEFQFFAQWLDPAYLSPDSEFTRAKFAAFKILPEHFSSPLNWIFGLGPGHTIGRLGGWMMEKYDYLLLPLGATRPYPTLTSEIMTTAIGESRGVTGTAMFGPLFSWTGIWGDLGFAGLASYLFIWLIVWTNFCADDFSRFLILATFVTGFFPGYLEEPGSMLFATFLIGLRWHEVREQKKMQKFEEITAPLVNMQLKSKAN